MFAAANVLPAPVAIWVSARGRSSRRDFSRFSIAHAWAGQSPAGSNTGIVRRRFLSVEAPARSLISRSHPASVADRWNANTGRLRGSGSALFVNRVSTPVDSYAKGNGRAGTLT